MNLQASKMFISHNSPSILTGFALAGVAATAISSIKAGIKAEQLYEQLYYTSEEPPTTKEKIKYLAPTFIPPIVFGMLTIACITTSHSINIRRQVALLSAYSLSEKALSETDKKLSDMLGEKKMKKLKDDLAKDNVISNPPSKDSIFDSGIGSIIMRDGVVGGPDFYTDVEFLKTVFNKINNRLNNLEYVTVNDLKYELGLPQATMWDDIGWGPGDQLDPYWTVLDIKKDLLMTDEEDLKEIYVLRYHKPTYLPNC